MDKRCTHLDVISQDRLVFWQRGYATAKNTHLKASQRLAVGVVTGRQSATALRKRFGLAQ